MNAPATDVQSTLTYGHEKLGRQLLILAVAMIVLGVIGISLDDSRKMVTVAWVVAAAGAALAVFELLMREGKPLLELSPEGITLRTLGDVFIPWPEVRGVDAIELTTWPGMSAPFPTKYSNLTVVLVSRDFYNSDIVPSLSAMAGGALKTTFVPKGESDNSTLMQVALHHDVLPVEPDELRRQVAARWHAFRGPDRPADAVPPSIGGKPVEFRIKWEKDERR